MHIYTKQAEERLKKQCENIASSPLAWRAVHFFEVNKKHASRRDELRVRLVVGLAKGLITDEEASFFFCEDGDIIVLCKGVGHAELAKFAQRLEEVFPADEGQQNAALLFDFSIRFKEFQRLCDMKWANYEVQHQNGTREVDSSPSSFSINPAYVKEEQEKRAYRDKINIQLVEDDVFTLQLVSRVFDKYETFKNTDGVSAVQTYFQEFPDILFLDINLPGLNGHEVMEKILEHDPQAYIVMLSGQTNMDDVQKAIQGGAKGFVAKPFSKEKLLKSLTTYMQRRKG